LKQEEKSAVVFGSIFLLWLAFLLMIPDDNTTRERAIPMTNSQRQVLKAFIMKKEAEALGPNDAADRDAAREMLETGAVDCLYGLHTLYQKLLRHEAESAFGASKGSHEEREFDAPKTVSNAGWLQAVAQRPIDAAKGANCANDERLDSEEARIASMLFDAADLDDKHSISFTEFAMLAVLMSATDARDADAQVGCSSNRRLSLGGGLV